MSVLIWKKYPPFDFPHKLNGFGTNVTKTALPIMTTMLVLQTMFPTEVVIQGIREFFLIKNTPKVHSALLSLFGNRVVHCQNGMEISIGGVNNMNDQPFQDILLRFPQWKSFQKIATLPIPVITPAVYTLNIQANLHQQYELVDKMRKQGFDKLILIFGGIGLDMVNDWPEYKAQFPSYTSGPARRIYCSKHIFAWFWQSSPSQTDSVYEFKRNRLLISKVKLNNSGPYHQNAKIVRPQHSTLLVYGYIRLVMQSDLAVKLFDFLYAYYNTTSPSIQITSLVWNISEVIPLHAVLSGLTSIKICRAKSHYFQVYSSSDYFCQSCGDNLSTFQT